MLGVQDGVGVALAVAVMVGVPVGEAVGEAVAVGVSVGTMASRKANTPHNPKTLKQKIAATNAAYTLQPSKNGVLARDLRISHHPIAGSIISEGL